MAMHTELWFPQVIWSKVATDLIDNQELKRWAYERKQNDVGRVVSNFGGFQSSDILPKDNSQIDILVEHLDKEVNWCSQQVGLPEMQITNIWLNINPPGSYNHLHNHIGAVFSGVYYVHGEENQGNIQFERMDGAEAFLPEYVAKQTYYSASRATYPCKTDGLYIFPGWLKHSVQGNQTNIDRISISFNYEDKS